MLGGLTEGPTMLSSGYLGANLRTVDWWTGSMMYVDVMRNARSFGKFPNDGYALPGVTAPTQFATLKPDGWPAESFVVSFISSLASYRYQDGTYEGSFTGTASAVSCPGGTVTNLRTVAGNKTRFQVTINGGSFSNPRLEVQNPSADFADLRLIRPGYAWDTTQLLTNEFLANIASYKTLRVMDHQRTSTTPQAHPGFESRSQTSWANRWTPTSTIWGQIMRPYTLEEQILVANTTNKDLWLCIPHAADDTYIEGMLQLVWATLNPSLKCYIEYSNEVWNPAQAYQYQLQHILTNARAEIGQYGGETLAADIESIVISGGGTLATITLKRPHTLTTGSQVKMQAGSGNTNVPFGVYTVTAVSSLVFTVPVTGRTDGTVTMSSANSNTLILTNMASDLHYDWVQGFNARAWWPSVRSEYTYAYRFAGKRIRRCAEIANTLFGAGQWQSRLRLVFALQYANPGTMLGVITYLDDLYGPVKDWLYAISGAVYVSAQSGDTTASAILSRMETDNETKRILYYRWVNTARYYGLKFVQYEIGPDMAVSTASAATKLVAESDARMTGIVRTMLTNATTMGCDGAMYYIEGVVGNPNEGGNFDLRRSVFDTADNNPRLKGQLEALATPLPEIYPAYWGATIPASTASNVAVENSPVVLGVGPYRTHIVSAGNILFERNRAPAGATVHGEFAFNLFVPSNGNYQITPRLGGHYSTPEVRVLVDDVDQGVSISTTSINGFVNPAPARPAFTLALTKGWHVLKFRTAAPVGAGGGLACAGITVS